ncbi:hydroxymethylbilane synthase [Segetibacter koreensis]|uniref:hydroxymethylbilane synthase n=1 Tax=Segetibacter koreensis TaxID=398037 RepID=UPI00036051A0|nr:hydroxymethylbilane synthase [Segetibacter koreensis]
MDSKVLRIGTRESQLAVWQANRVKELLSQQGYSSELVCIKSEGDIDLKTPLYEIGVQGIFTRSLDIALLNNRIDLAVHSMKDVPTQLPKGIVQSAVLKRASYKDLFVYKDEAFIEKWQLNSNFLNSPLQVTGSIATSSIRRKAQWLNRYPNHTVENLRGNVNTRLRKVAESEWDGAIFAAAGLERIDLRPEKSIELDWMIPAPAQGAIVVVCRGEDVFSLEACTPFNDANTALCTKIEKDFLRKLLGGCSTPISALAEIDNEMLYFKGNIFAVDGSERADVEKAVNIKDAANLGEIAALEVLANGGQVIADSIHHER